MEKRKKGPITLSGLLAADSGRRMVEVTGTVTGEGMHGVVFVFLDGVLVPGVTAATTSTETRQGEVTFVRHAGDGRPILKDGEYETQTLRGRVRVFEAN